MRFIALLASLLSVAAPLGALAGDGPLPTGYTARLSMTCEGERLASAMVESDAEGRFTVDVHDRIPYVRAVSVDGGGRQTRTIRDELVMGAGMVVAARRDGDDLALDIDGEVAELKEMRHASFDGRAVDLPDVRRCAFRGKATARRDGDGWRLDRAESPGGIGLTVSIVPGTP